MDNPCYRVVSPLSGVQSTSTLPGRIYVDVPADRPDHPSCFEGEWVCSHTLCPVRTVRLRVKACYHKHLPRLRCPLCLRLLDFRHWLAAIALQEVPAEPTKKKPRQSVATEGGVRPRKRKAALKTGVASPL